MVSAMGREGKRVQSLAVSKDLKDKALLMSLECPISQAVIEM